MIGVFGGTFNPIHNAHIKLALEVQQFLQLDHVRMILCGIPPHRASPAVTPEIRFSLLQTAIKQYPKLVADDLELTRSGPSYMIDTLESLKRKYADSLCLILGIDAYNNLDSWKDWRAIFDLCHVVVMRRPDIDTMKSCSSVLSEFTRSRVSDNRQDLFDTPAGKIMFLSNTEFDISSSRLREKLATGKSTGNMLPESVNKDIREQSLYTKEYDDYTT